MLRDVAAATVGISDGCGCAAFTKAVDVECWVACVSAAIAAVWAAAALKIVAGGVAGVVIMAVVVAGMLWRCD